MSCCPLVIKKTTTTHLIVFLLLPFTRTEVLECYGDQDFLAKLHCVRQAFQVCHSSHDLTVVHSLCQKLFKTT